MSGEGERSAFFLFFLSCPSFSSIYLYSLHPFPLFLSPFLFPFLFSFPPADGHSGGLFQWPQTKSSRLAGGISGRTWDTFLFPLLCSLHFSAALISSSPGVIKGSHRDEKKGFSPVLSFEHSLPKSKQHFINRSHKGKERNKESAKMKER